MRMERYRLALARTVGTMPMGDGRFALTCGNKVIFVQRPEDPLDLEVVAEILKQAILAYDPDR